MSQVVRERQCLNKLFQTTQGALVALAIDSLEVWRDGGEQLGDVGEASVDFLLDVGWEVGIDLFYPTSELAMIHKDDCE